MGSFDGSDATMRGNLAVLRWHGTRLLLRTLAYTRDDRASSAAASTSTVPPESSSAEGDSGTALCRRADVCLGELGGGPQTNKCMEWCGAKVSPVESCATCFATQKCAAIFIDPTAPWDITHLNPGACIKDCGLGTCEGDHECAPGKVCAADGDKVVCVAGK